MATDGMFLEDSDGGRKNNPSEADIRATIARIGDSLDHCILHLPGDAFVQTAGGQNRLLIQYADASGFFESATADFDSATVGSIFAAAMAGDDAWKGQYVFEKTGEAEGETEAGGGGASRMDRPASPEGSATPVAGGSLKDQLLGSVKRELNREASRGIGNLVRKGIRSLTDRR
ncbi:MAG: hypothetical protein ACOCW6_07550 [Spirochaetota bacterium]